MFLGIEIGGTKLQLGVGAGDGSPLVDLIRLDVNAEQGAAAILEQIKLAGRRLLATHDVARIGIGFGGPVDRRGGRILKSHQVAGWEDVPIVDWCRQQYGMSAILGNDCDAAALAEARFGAGQGSQTAFFVTVGTGIGGGLVIDGELHGAGRPAVAEIGHLRPGPQAFAPDVTVESVASGRGIEAAVRQRLGAVSLNEHRAANQLMTACGGDPTLLTAKMIATAAEGGNSLASEVLDEASRVLGWAIAQVITLLAPEVVVVGGGVSLMGDDRFFEPLRRTVARYVFRPLRSSYRIVPAELGEEVVVHGAIALAAEGS